MSNAGQIAEPLTPMVAEPLTFPQRMFQAIRPPQRQDQRGAPQPTRRAGKLVPGRPLPHIVLSTVQVHSGCHMVCLAHEKVFHVMSKSHLAWTMENPMQLYQHLQGCNAGRQN